MLQSEPMRSRTSAEPLEPLITPGEDFKSINERIGSIVLSPPEKTPRGWIFGFALAFLLLMLFFYALFMLFAMGVGIWGVNVPVGWGFAIINFVWWIGIGHAGTLISAILLLFAQSWRNSINRLAEAMTLFAVACAGLYPIVHLGRFWFFYWLIPYPNTMGMWPQFRSPLAWDVFAVSTYATVSLLFWLVGLIPDFAKLRDKATTQTSRVIFGLAALGWRGSARHWHRYEKAYMLLAGLSTPLVVSVHSIISLDFAVSIVPGWNATIFPPYFVAGAVFAGFAMVLLLMIPIRKFYKLEAYVTMRHIDNMAKIMLATGMVVVYGYLVELFMAWYSGVEIELFLASNRLFGPYGWSFWALIFCNGLVPQLMWFSKLRANLGVVFFVSFVVSIGMWLERFVIVVGSLYRDYLPSSWDMFIPTFWDYALYAGTIGLFFSLLFLFMRVLPMINVFEMQLLQYEIDEQAHRTHSDAHAAGH